MDRHSTGPAPSDSEMRCAHTVYGFPLRKPNQPIINQTPPTWSTGIPMVMERVRSGWACYLITFMFNQIRGPRTTTILRMKDAIQLCIPRCWPASLDTPSVHLQMIFRFSLGALTSSRQARSCFSTSNGLQWRASFPQCVTDPTGFGNFGQSFLAIWKSLCGTRQVAPPSPRGAGDPRAWTCRRLCDEVCASRSRVIWRRNIGPSTHARWGGEWKASKHSPPRRGLGA